MRITLIAVKFNLVSSISNDILLKSKILKELGHEVTVVTLMSKKNNIIPNLPFKLYEEYTPSMRLFPLHKFAVKIMRKYSDQTDVFYMTSDAFSFGSGWYRRFTKNSKPVVTYFNGYIEFAEQDFKKFPLWPRKYLAIEDSFKFKIRLLIERTIGAWLINQIDRKFAMSKTVANYHMKAGIRDVGSMTDFYDLDSLTIKSPLPSPFEKYPEDIFHILFTGRIYIGKSPDLLIEAFKNLRNINKCMLHFVGEGEMREEMEARVKELGLEEKIIFHGWKIQKEIVPFLQHANIYVQPTRIPEPMNRATVEAMANGLPLVVTSTSMEPWVDEVAVTFTNGDIKDLTDAMDRIYENKELRKSMSEKGPIYAQGFSYKVLGPKLENVFKNLVEKTKTGQ